MLLEKFPNLVKRYIERNRSYNVRGKILRTAWVRMAHSFYDAEFNLGSISALIMENNPTGIGSTSSFDKLRTRPEQGRRPSLTILRRTILSLPKEPVVPLLAPPLHARAGLSRPKCCAGQTHLVTSRKAAFCRSKRHTRHFAPEGAHLAIAS